MLEYLLPYRFTINVVLPKGLTLNYECARDGGLLFIQTLTLRTLEITFVPSCRVFLLRPQCSFKEIYSVFRGENRQ